MEADAATIPLSAIAAIDQPRNPTPGLDTKPRRPPDRQSRHLSRRRRLISDMEIAVRTGRRIMDGKRFPWPRFDAMDDDQ